MDGWTDPSMPPLSPIHSRSDEWVSLKGVTNMKSHQFLFNLSFNIYFLNIDISGMHSHISMKVQQLVNNIFKGRTVFFFSLALSFDFAIKEILSTISLLHKIKTRL